MKGIPTLLIAAFFPVLISVSCSRDKKDTGVPEYSITFSFEHKAGQDSLEFDTIRYTNAFGNHYSVITLKYFVSDFALHKQDGSILLIDEAHYIDAASPGTHTFVPSLKVPAGSYSGISFIFGLDSTMNVPGRFLNPPENMMEWPAPLGGGYHYMKLEGKFDSSGMIKNFQAHTGPLMGVAYFINIDLAGSSFTVGSQGVTVRLIMDVDQWWRDPVILDLNSITSVMDNPVIQLQLKENGADVFSVESIR